MSEVSTTSLSEEEETVTDSDLYTMTETELQSLVSEGTITRADMEDELARRAGATEIEES